MIVMSQQAILACERICQKEKICCIKGDQKTENYVTYRRHILYYGKLGTSRKESRRNGSWDMANICVGGSRKASKI